ncbi:MAG: dihydroorotase, partial [Candidatus Saccharimonadales bacterium]
IVMPNTCPPILTGEGVARYRKEIDAANNGEPFEPLMTIEIRDGTTPKTIQKARKAGAVAGKVYLRGTTTNADEGLTSFFNPKIADTFRAMRDEGMLLLLHGELAEDRLLVTEREQAFIGRVFRRLIDDIPGLKIVLEHISTRYAVQAVLEAGKNVAATVTAHHLCTTLNDVIGHGVKPHNACNPTPKGFTDMDALVLAAISGNSKFFLGSDSAPHPRKLKECSRGACGVFSAPILLPLLAQIFEQQGALDKLENFISRFGAEFYGLPLNKETVTLERKAWRVPCHYYGELIPFMASETLSWRAA